jgi:hypothetical protein
VSFNFSKYNNPGIYVKIDTILIIRIPLVLLPNFFTIYYENLIQK